MFRVALHNDHVTCFEVVVHYLQTLCSFSFDDALGLTRRIDQDGTADVAELPGRDEAEQLAVAFQRRGIHASVRTA
ncbi:ATP-dependent Clp protease adaptor ClpS [Actinophytocola sp. NPDC049390]|uniref:ATP-dependent Clp protease adaptor ClpS n=1 Tax=Actinophytocola sp. NPDC049390 TaxID=3363894 RepID=UPI00379DB85D